MFFFGNWQFISLQLHSVIWQILSIVFFCTVLINIGLQLPRLWLFHVLVCVLHGLTYYLFLYMNCLYIMCVSVYVCITDRSSCLFKCLSLYKWPSQPFRFRFFLHHLTLTKDKKTPSTRDEVLLCLHITDNLANNQFEIVSSGIFFFF